MPVFVTEILRFGNAGVKVFASCFMHCLWMYSFILEPVCMQPLCGEILMWLSSLLLYILLVGLRMNRAVHEQLVLGSIISLFWIIHQEIEPSSSGNLRLV